MNDIECLKAALARMEDALAARYAESVAESRPAETAAGEVVAALLNCKDQLSYAIAKIEDERN